MYSAFSSFFIAIIIILIIHFLIKHYLLYLPKISSKKVRFNPNLEIKYFSDESESESESVNENKNKNIIPKSKNKKVSNKSNDSVKLKSELLQYVKSYEKSVNNKEEPILDGDDRSK